MALSRNRRTAVGVRGWFVLLLGLALAFGAVGAGGAGGVGPQRDRPVDDDAALAAALGVSDLDLQDLQLRQVERSVQVTVILDGVPRQIVLQLHSLRADDFILLEEGADGALRLVEPPAAQTYRGTVVGEPGSIVAVSLHEESMAGMIRMGESQWGVQPLRDISPDAPAGRHAVYRQDDINLPPGLGLCGVVDEVPIEPAGGVGADGGGIAGVGGSGGKEVDIALDADVEFYVANGSSTPNTLADMELIMNVVEAIYDAAFNIQYRITGTIVRTAEPDAYSSTVPSTLLCQFRNFWNANHAGIARDIAHLFTGKDIDGGTIGIAYGGSSGGVVCNVVANVGGCTGVGNAAYALSQSRWTTSLMLRVGLTAHEIGHNFHASHCDGAGDCSIMCSGIGGCSGQVALFGATESAEITPYANSIGCLAAVGACCVGTSCTQTSLPGCNALSGTWTAGGSCGTRSAFSGSAGGVAIPDANATGVSHTINVASSFTISDLNVRVNAPHSWVGDLVVRLSHNGGPPVVLINRIGVPASQFGCFSNNLNVLLDDEAAAGPIENICGSTVFPVSGPSFGPSSPLSAFDGQNASGAWTLTVIDGDGGETGTFASWALDIENAATSLCDPPCPADIAPGGPPAGDGNVDVNDLLALIGAWGPCSAPCPPCPGDINGDCVIDVNDLLALIGAWGPCP